jgi:uncharacterized membrane protein HdeD (DUF308 family)
MEVMEAKVTTMEVTLIPWWIVFLEGAVALIIGLFLLFRPDTTLAVLVQLLGIFWLVSGVLTLFSMFKDSENRGWKLFGGILGIIAGLILIGQPLVSTYIVITTLVVIVGIMGIIIGAMAVFQGFRGDWGIAIIGLISILFGLLLLGSPYIGYASLPYILGFLGVVGGLAAMVMGFKMRA